ncbi:unnamed protein product [Linum trigynum]|uniref:Uncharacterized protein n=1 Tax=Linum trigynum TaxID=586398 RepID=A0AAV2CUQ0_9ROSI
MKSLCCHSPLVHSSSAELTVTALYKPSIPNSHKKLPVTAASSSYSFPKSLPLVATAAAASVAILLSATPAEAGFMSGFSGIESVPGPELPKMDFLTRFNEDNQKKYAEEDERFKSSPILKELLEKSKLNKEKNKQEIQDKYCLRGAEWGVGDCSTEGMSPQQREEFIAMLKKKTGIEE